MFGKKKKEEVKEEEPKTETAEVKGQTAAEKPLPNLGSVLLKEFGKDYDNVFCIKDLASMPQAERQAMELNLLLAIYGELRLIRDAANKE